jgi:hypothetical protein
MAQSDYATGPTHSVLRPVQLMRGSWQYVAVMVAILRSTMNMTVHIGATWN